MRKARCHHRAFCLCGGLKVGMPQVGSKPLAHQVHEIVAVEALDGARRSACETVVKPLERVAPAFHMREVGREQADLVATVGDDPADILMRIRRDAKLAPQGVRNVVKTFQNKGLQFQAWTFALYAPESKALTVRHDSREVIEQIDDLLAAFTEQSGVEGKQR